MVVYVCCAGGATSSLMCSHIQKAGESSMNIFFDSIDVITKKLENNELKQYDLILAYGPADAISESFLTKFNFNKNYDLVLVSPQVRFHIPKIKKLLSPLSIPCDGIDMRTFGTMNGAKMIEQIKKYM